MNILSDNWFAAGYGIADLRKTIVQLDRATTHMTVSTRLIDILDLGNAFISEGTKYISYHVLNQKVLEQLYEKYNFQFLSVKVREDDVKEYWEDWVKNGCLFRFGFGDMEWFSLSSKIFNCLGGSSGERFNGLDPGFPRNLALAQYFVNHPEELTFVIRRDKKYQKVFAANRGNYQYIKQGFFLNGIEHLLEQFNQDGSHWEVAEWYVDNFKTRIQVEDRKKTKLLKMAGLNITPTLCFQTSDTGDSSFTGQSCVKRNDETYFVLNTISRKHTKGLDIADFFEACKGLAQEAEYYVTQLDALKFVPARERSFENVVGKIQFDKKDNVGKREWLKLTENEALLSAREDKTERDIASRVLSLPGKLKSGANTRRNICHKLSRVMFYPEGGANKS